MTGTVTATRRGPEGRMVATVALEDGRRFEVPYWPELLEQWGAEPLRTWLVNEAATTAAQLDTRAAFDHSALHGEAAAAPVCRKGEIDCTDPHEEPADDQGGRRRRRNRATVGTP
jgi:hypothetical protein